MWSIHKSLAFLRWGAGNYGIFYGFSHYTVATSIMWRLLVKRTAGDIPTGHWHSWLRPGDEMPRFRAAGKGRPVACLWKASLKMGVLLKVTKADSRKWVILCELGILCLGEAWKRGQFRNRQSCRLPPNPDGWGWRENDWLIKWVVTMEKLSCLLSSWPQNGGVSCDMSGHLGTPINTMAIWNEPMSGVGLAEIKNIYMFKL